MATLQDWWARSGLDPGPEASEISRSVVVTGDDPVLGVAHRVGGAAAAALALVGAQAAVHHVERGGPAQSVSVDVSSAAASLLGFALQRIDGYDLQRHHNATIDQYPTADGRWIHLHGGFPHLADGLLELLSLPPGALDDRGAVAEAVALWHGEELEESVADAGLCAALVRSPVEWGVHPQGAHLASLPAVTIERLGDEPQRTRRRRVRGPYVDRSRPLDGVRVLDQTRVLAGPTCGRTLASLGAEVLRIGAPRLPSIEPFVIDTGHGKRNAIVDLATSDGASAFAALVSGADVVVQGYRQGALDRYGASPAELVAMRPGVVVVQITCYGSTGPWATRAGWEQLAQSATGMSWDEGAEDSSGCRVPAQVPAAVCDYTTGYLAAAGVIAALRRRDAEGGSWLVRASLAQTAMWIQGAGHVADLRRPSGLDRTIADLDATDTVWGLLHHLPPVLGLSATPCRWDRPPEPLGSSPALWG
jgi:crotonobetainyl-CoA:carnitine CoA-transferase CaiB-like acyl-CoA transferase